MRGIDMTPKKRPSAQSSMGTHLLDMSAILADLEPELTAIFNRRRVPQSLRDDLRDRVVDEAMRFDLLSDCSDERKRALVLRIADRRAVDLYRHHRRITDDVALDSLVSEELMPDDAIIWREMAVGFAAAFAKLKPEQQEIIALELIFHRGRKNYSQYGLFKYLSDYLPYSGWILRIRRQGAWSALLKNLRRMGQESLAKEIEQRLPAYPGK
jgi:hypothetical protein